ncbi:MAG: nuclear transport factor 2 family protein, partial [Candidatus Omnitrophica bacterium]|nr:nuclear transport factor 2 family protein [Candidatus Omnitrophota bacterium]
MKFSTAIFSLVVPTLSFVSVAQDDPQSGDRVMIQATIESYVDAFNEHDAEKLASTWTEECNYVDMTGRMVEGRDTILGEYKDYFRMNPEATMQIHLLSMNMASEDVAIEDGIREIVVAPGSEPNNIRYTAIHVRDGDRWLVKSVRDAVAFEQTNYQYLRGLEWLVGEWSDEGTDGVTMNSSCNWSQNRNFLIGNFSSFSGDKMIISGTQWIGWDPINK